MTYVKFYDPLFPIQVLRYSLAIFSFILATKGLQNRCNNMLPHMVIRSIFSVQFSRSALIVSRLGPSQLALFPFTVSTACFSISGILTLEFCFVELYYCLALPIFRSVPYV